MGDTAGSPGDAQEERLKRLRTPRDRRALATPTPIDVCGPDGLTPTEPTKTPEDPGPYCFPPVAASITAAARLMPALVEHKITQAPENSAPPR
jgi:hypothetical protein